MRPRWWWGLGALALLLAGWGWHARTANDGPVVELGAVETRDQFRSYVTASGEIVAERFADIGSSSMGRVVELPVIEGQAVREGDLLARIDPVQARSELAAAEAGIRALEAEAEADVLRVRTGQPARVTLEALPGRSFAGTVTEVGASALLSWARGPRPGSSGWRSAPGPLARAG